MLKRVDGHWQPAGGRAFENVDGEDATTKADRHGADWAGDDPNRRYDVVVKR